VKRIWTSGKQGAGKQDIKEAGNWNSRKSGNYGILDARYSMLTIHQLTN
jgi:hypothetical protein